MEKYEYENFIKEVDYFYNLPMQESSHSRGLAVGKGEQLKGKPSMINRYSLFSYRGDVISKDIQSTFPNSLAQTGYKENSNFVNNPSASSIIEYFRKGVKGQVEYDWGDFIYLKYYGKIPNNYMITLRRFPNPVPDNIYFNKIHPQPDIARIVTFMGEESSNKLSDILKLKHKLKFERQESEIQTINSPSFNLPKGLQNNMLVNAVGAANNNNGIGVKGIDANAQKIGNNNQSTDDTWSIQAMGNNRIYGTPFDVIDSMEMRVRGIEQSIEGLTISAEYTARAWGNKTPKEAMLEIISNILIFSFNNAPFWGGAIRMNGDLRYNTFGEKNTAFFKAGNYSSLIQNIMSDFTRNATKLFANNGKGLLGVLEGLGRLKLNQMVDSSQMRRAEDAVTPLLTGAPTGQWHITIGNPFRPIVVLGNMILDDTNIEFGNSLGAEDFPTSLKVTFTFKQGRPRDLTDLSSMFNLGNGRMYIPFKDSSNVMNKYIEGKKKEDTLRKDKKITGDIPDELVESDLVGDFRLGSWREGAFLANALLFHPVGDLIEPKETPNTSDKAPTADPNNKGK